MGMDWSKKIYPCITTGPKQSWQFKIWECDRLGVTEVSVFPTFLRLNERKKLYLALERSNIKYIPHVHIRDDFKKWEMDFFFKKYGTRCFNIHEHSFDDLHNYPKYRKYIYLEYNYNNRIPKTVKVNKISGLCIDFSHMWAAKNRGAKEFDEINNNLRSFKVGCNHLNGYSYRYRRDIHFVADKKQLDYLKEVPKKYFSHIISLEMQNSIHEQLKYKNYIVKILNK